MLFNNKVIWTYSLPGDFGDVPWGRENQFPTVSLLEKPGDLASLFILKLLGWIYPFFLHFFATWESLFWRFLVKVRSCGHFFCFSSACNVVYDIGYESKTNDIEVKPKFTPKGASNNDKSLHFVQSCISKAVLWPPILLYVRSLLLNSAGVWGRCKPSVGPGQSPGGGPGGDAPGRSENAVIYSTTKGSKIPLSR